MSSETITSYEVERQRNEQIRQRAESEARIRLRELADSCEAEASLCRTKANRLGQTFVAGNYRRESTDTASLQWLENEVARLASEYAALVRRRRELEASIVSEQIFSDLGDRFRSLLERETTEASVVTGATKRRPVGALQESAALLRRAAVFLDPPRIDELKERLQQIGEARSYEKAWSLLAHFDGSLVEIIRNGELRLEDVEWAERRVAELRGLSGDDVEDVRADLEAVRTCRASADEALRKRVLQVHSQAKSRDDAEYVCDAIKDALTSMGYEVEDSFATILIRDGTVSISRPPQKHYALEIHLNPDKQTIGTEVIRIGQRSSSARQAAIDDEFTQRWCADHDGLTERLSERGIRFTVEATKRNPQKPVRTLKSLPKQLDDEEIQLREREVRNDRA